MNPADPNLQRVELVARALGDLCDELIFVGGCAAGMLCTSVQAPPPRATFDVDLVAEVTALAGYHALEARFTARGFVRDMAPDAPICRWRVGNVEVDLMPTDERVLGFSNRWYPIATATAMPMVLPSGVFRRSAASSGFRKHLARPRGLRRALRQPDRDRSSPRNRHREPEPDMNASTLVQNHWNCCNVLRDNGTSKVGAGAAAATWLSMRA